MLEPEPYPTAISRSFTFEFSSSRKDPHKFPGTAPELGIFGRRSMLLLSSLWRTDFPCTQQYMVLGCVPKLLEPSSAKLFRILSVAAKRSLNIALIKESYQAIKCD